MAEGKTFSIIIYIDKVDEAVGKCLAAISNQYYSREKYELLICISEENSSGLSGSEGEIRYIDSKTITGKNSADARNKAAAEASGKYLLFLDSSAAVLPSFLPEHEKAREKYNEAPIAVAGLYCYSAGISGRPFAYFLSRKPLLDYYPVMTPHRFYNYRYFRISNVSVPRDIFLKSGGLNPEFSGTVLESIELGYRLEKLGCNLLYRPEAGAETGKIPSIGEFAEAEELRGEQSVRYYELHPELIGREKMITGISEFSNASVESLRKYVVESENINKIVSILERLDKSRIENPEFIPLNNGRYINSDELTELFSKYIGILSRRSLYSGILRGLKKYGTPVYRDWRINEKNALKKHSGKKPRILFTLSKTGRQSRDNKFILKVAENLARIGHEVSVFVVTLSRETVGIPYRLSVESEGNCRVITMTISRKSSSFEDFPELEIRSSKALMRFKEALDLSKPDVIVYTSFVGLSFDAAKLSRERNIPAVYMPGDYHLIDPRLYLMRTFVEPWAGTDILANTPLGDRNPEKIELYKERANAARDIINKYTEISLMRSEYDRAIFTAYGCDKGNMRVMERIPCTVSDISSVDSADATIRFGYIGDAVPHKGLHKILQATEYIPNTDFEIVVFGNSYPPYLRQLQKMPGADLVSWNAPTCLEETDKTYSAFDVLIVPSLREIGDDLTVRKAFAAKLPVLASDSGGLPEYVTHGRTGLIYPANREKSLAELMLNLIKKPFLIEKLKENIIPDKTFDDMTEKLAKVLKKVAKRIPVEKI